MATPGASLASAPASDPSRSDFGGTPGEVAPRDFLRRHRLLPLRRTTDGGYAVAVVDEEGEGIGDLAFRLGVPVHPILASREVIAAALEVTADSMAQPPPQLDATAPGSDDTRIVADVHQLILEGIQRRASDIHLEPQARRLQLRYRIDGALIEGPPPPKARQLPIVSRLKILANLSIAEKRIPQDGRIQLTVDRRRFDLRVSSLPTLHGESIVMRVLDQQQVLPGFAALGLADDDHTTLRSLIGRPDGIVLVTGPTGSGKTTTLYTCLQAVNQRERKIITVEDPVEYLLRGINQVPVRPEAGVTFAAALRAILRQSPNIIMVGEIRDRETADIAVHAALTGHLVLSTLHTNDAAGAVTRLIDLGVKPYLVAAALRGCLAQRLVRRLCPSCRRVSQPAKGPGCPECQQTGYRGRVGLFEFLVMDEALQRLVHSQASHAMLRRHCRERGRRTLREDGLDKVTRGFTTLEEVVSITADAR
jgi:type IV pilus assembly protein PilB